MQISVQSSGALERDMRVEIPEEKITTQVQKRLKSLVKTTRLQGFRPGKVPLKLIQQRFGSQVRQEVVGELVQSSFYDAIVQEKLRPAGSPHIDQLDSEQGQGIVYTAKFEVMPEFELGKIEELKVEKPVCEITENDIDKMIEVLRKQRQELNDVDRQAIMDDVVDIDFKGTIDGEPFEGSEANHFKAVLGQKQLIDGFEDGLIGKKAGDEVSLKLVFPEDYQVKELAGKAVEFQIKINSVQEPVLAELNDSFFVNFGVKEGGLAAFRKEILSHMQRESDMKNRNKFKDSVMAALHEANSVDLPKTLVDKAIQDLQKQFDDTVKSQGLDVDAETITKQGPLFEEQGRKRVALQLILAELIRKHALKADPAKVRAMIEKNAASYEDPSAIINWYYNDKKNLAEIESLTLEDEVIDLIAERARLTEMKLTFDECMNKGQTETD
ncbi:MAG: trigger factor [Proteobacteria bacterium]|nr:trigger factor [Pseudomonadota bacterium]